MGCNNCSVILIAHNEEANIALMIQRLMEGYTDKILEMIIVDDASTDKTPEIVKDLICRYPKVKLISKSPPCGVGYAMKRGLREVNTQADYVLTMDSDFIESIPEVKLLLEEAQNGKEAIIGSRFLKDSKLIGYPKSKWIANRFYHFMVRLVLGILQHDITNNLKLYKSDIFKKIPLRSNGFAINAEIGILPVLFGFDLTEVPVSWIERSGTMGKSKFSIFRVWLDYALSLFWCFLVKVNRQIKYSHKC